MARKYSVTVMETFLYLTLKILSKIIAIFVSNFVMTFQCMEIIRLLDKVGWKIFWVRGGKYSVSVMENILSWT